MTLIIGTIAGALGAARAKCVAGLLAPVRPGIEAGFTAFDDVERLRDALRAGEVDLAVHAFEQLPPVRAEGLVLAAVPFRGDAREALAGRARGPLRTLPPLTKIAVATELRRAQLAASCPHLDVHLLACDAEGVLAALEAGGGGADAGVVGLAELQLLGFEGKYRALGFEEMLPAPAQGALVLECREGDTAGRALAAAIDRPELRLIAGAERAFLAASAAACGLPAAAWAEIFGTTLKLNGLLVAPGRIVRSKMAGPLETAAGLGRALAEELCALAGGE